MRQHAFPAAALAPAILVSLVAWTLTACGSQRHPSAGPARMRGDTLDLVPLLIDAGGSPALPAGEPEEVYALSFTTPEAVARVRADRFAENLRQDGGHLSYDVTAQGNLVTWACDLDASKITHVEISGVRVLYGRGPAHLVWRGPDDAGGTWRFRPFQMKFDGIPHRVSVPLEDSYDWRGRIVRMGVRFGIPPYKLLAGPIPIEIGAIRCLRLDLGTRRRIEGLPPSIRRASIRKESRVVVHVPTPARLAVPLEVPDRARLDFAIGVPSFLHGKSEGVVTFRVRFDEEVLFERTLDCAGNPDDRGWMDVTVPLDSLAGRTGTLTFEALGAGPGGSGGHAFWAHPVLCRPRNTQGPPNLLLISIDTLRADHLGCYGYPRNTSPVIDAFAKESILFENAFSQAPETVSSHMTLFTSLYPTTHGIQRLNESKVLGEGVPTLAMLLRNLDTPYATAAFTEGGGVSSAVGFAHGFDRYDNSDLVTARSEKLVETTYGNAARWLRRNADRRFFLFVHTYEVHTPYDPPGPLESCFCPDYEGPIEPPVSWDRVEKLLLRRKLRYGDPGVQRLMCLYDGGIRNTDRYLGRLLATVRRLGLMKNTWVVLLADHGEDFFDHLNVASHGLSLYDEMIHVPLVLRPPGGRDGAPPRIARPVGLIDVMPTLLERFGIHPPEGLQGRSFAACLDAARAAAVEERPIFMEDLTGIIRFGVRYHGIKRVLSPGLAGNNLMDLIRRYEDVVRLDRFHGILQEKEVFDLEADPQERVNLLFPDGRDREGYHAQRLERWIREIEAARRKTRHGPPIDPSDLQRLRALGYLEGFDLAPQAAEGRRE